MEQEDVKKVRKEICERWKSFGFTEGLSGKRLEKVVELFETVIKQKGED